MTYKKLFALVLVTLALSSCGNKGELFLPNANTAKAEEGKK